MTNNDKELIVGDGSRNNYKFICMSNIQHGRAFYILCSLLCLILTLLIIFGTYATMKASAQHQHEIKPSVKDTCSIAQHNAELEQEIHKLQISSAIFRKKKELPDIVRKKRSANDIIRDNTERDNNNIIKRNAETDGVDIEHFLEMKYKEVMNDEEDLEEDEGEATAESSSNFLTKRQIRKKRSVTLDGLDPVMLNYVPRLENKKREKRQVEEKLEQAKSDYIRCRKEAKPGFQCDHLYQIVMDNFREITKKFNEIEDIIKEMHPPDQQQLSAIQEASDKNKDKQDKKNKKDKKDKKKKDKKQSSEESGESNEKFTTVESTTKPQVTTESTTRKQPAAAFADTIDEIAVKPTTLSTTTKVTAKPMIVQPDNLIDDNGDESTSEIPEETTLIPDASSTIHAKLKVVSTTTTTTTPAATTLVSSSTINPITKIDSSSDSPLMQTADIGSCPVNDFKGHPRFDEELEGDTKWYRKHPTHHEVSDQFVVKKLQRGDKLIEKHPQRGDQTVNDLSDYAHPKANTRCDKSAGREAFEEELTEGEAPESTVQKPVPGTKISDAGPFLQLCEQMARTNVNKQAIPPAQFAEQFVPLSQMTNFGGPAGHFPVTGETMKSNSKVMMNPGYNLMPYPVCFVSYPYQQYRQQPFFYPNMMQNVHQQQTYPGGYYVPTASPYQGNYVKTVPVAVNQQGLTMHQQIFRDAPPPQGQHPTYCTFLANNGANFPAHFARENEGNEETSQAAAGAGTMDEIDEEDERAKTFNIPSQYDIIYATYPNQMYSMNKSMHHNHCQQDELSCFGTNQCIKKSNWCDSKVECLDASDETACSCKARLSEKKICDGYIDCPMGSDELGCFGCDKFQYSCYNNRNEYDNNKQSSKMMCYSSIEKCDGFPNCLNNKDEMDCSLIAKNVGEMMSYSVSHSEGILHRNFKGRWFPVCSNPIKWATEACESELGPIESPPFFAVRNSAIPGPFIQPQVNEQNEVLNIDPAFTDQCQSRGQSLEKNNVIYVKCPAPKCGVTKMMSASQAPFSRAADAELRNKRADDRIVGGFNASPMEFPFIVAIYKDGSFHCGGTIYNENWIITAAHCTRGFEDHFYEIRAGLLRRFSYSPSVQITKVAHVIKHKEYEAATMKNDIALMKMKIPLSFNRWVRPICLPAQGRSSMKDDWVFGPAAGTLCTTLGWGAIREKGPDPDDLKVVEVPINEHCKYQSDKEGASVCAGEPKGGFDACQGDSGGPLICSSMSNPKEWYLAGIVSHGEGCARANEPGVYTRTALYIDWIHERTAAPVTSSSNPRHHCPGFVCVWGGNKCISKYQKCDGIVDCLGGEDEIECPMSFLDFLVNSAHESNSTEVISKPTELPETPGNNTVVKKEIKTKKFTCTKIRQIINLSQRCDRIVDCEDSTDELNCTCKEHLRGFSQQLICDGTVDCADGTDENGCFTCKDTEFACHHSKKCIPNSAKCDGNKDCDYFEDELDCIALTDGHSVMLDVNSKPYLNFKGIVTRNVMSEWKILCNDEGDFKTNETEAATNICKIIGFHAVKDFKLVEMLATHFETSHGDLIKIDPTNAIDIRNRALKKHKENVTESHSNCKAMFVECLPYQTSSHSNHPFDHKKTKTNTTKPIEPELIPYFEASNSTDVNVIIIKPGNVFPSNFIDKPEWDHLHDFSWPWSAEIYANGELKSNGILLDKNWVLAERDCLGNVGEPLHTNHITVLLGSSKAHLNIQGPYEQISKIDCIQYVNDSNIVLLHLHKPAHFNRHVLPTFLPIEHEVEPDTKCIVLAIDSNKRVRTMELKIVEKCDGAGGDCYQRAVHNASDIEKDSCDVIHRSGAIVCKTKTSGWYPKGFHSMHNGFCDFNDPISLLLLSKNKLYNKIQQIIENPCEKCEHHAVNLVCDAYRCPLGNCLLNNELCDGKRDCHDGSDEEGSTCTKLKASDHCNHSEFQCSNGKCVDKSKFCNRVDDCGDLTDEPTDCTCFSYLKSTDPSKLCDGVRNCYDKEDESPHYCSNQCPLEKSFKCGETIYCVPLEFVCDNDYDCPNGADEKYCQGIYHHPDGDGFGEIMQRSYGIWHTKCFPKTSPPSQEVLEDICKQLGFKSVIKVHGRVLNEDSTDASKMVQYLTDHNNPPDAIAIDFYRHNATKAVLYNKFSPVKLNKIFTVHMKPSKPLAKLVAWDKTDKKECHRLELHCEIDQ